MRTRRTRVPAALAPVALALGLVLATAPTPAQAQVPPAVTGTLTPRVNFDGAGKCFVGGDPDGADLAPLDSGGQPTTATAATSGVLVAPGDPDDTTKVSARSTVSGVITEAFGRLDHAHLDLSAAAKVNALVGATSVCRAVAGGIAEASFQVDLATPAILRITATASSGVRVLSTQIGDGSAGTLLIDASLGTPGSHERVVLAPAGTYVFLVAAVVLAQAPRTGTSHLATAHGTASYDLTYHDVGTAVGPARGTGTRYVDTPDSRACVSQSLATTFTPKAAQVRSATFSVNGKVLQTVHGPQAGALVLNGLPQTRDAALTVALRLSRHRTATLHRTYYRCG